MLIYRIAHIMLIAENFGSLTINFASIYIIII